MMNRHKMKELIDSLLEGDISEADFVKLEAELSVDDDLRKEYLKRVALSSLLEVEAENTIASDGEGDVSPPLAVDSNASYSNTWRWIAGSGLLVVASAAFLIWFRNPVQTPPGRTLTPTQTASTPAQIEKAVKLLNEMIGDAKTDGEIDEDERTAIIEHVESRDLESAAAGMFMDALQKTANAGATGYGVISGQHDVIWADGDTHPTGSLLPTKHLKLTRGVVQVELFSGVSVVLEGPAEFEVTSPMHMQVASGKLRAHVPEPAHGFRVSTLEGDVVDLGTDFAVDVSSTRSEFHVLEGEIEVESKGNKTRRLTKGQAISSSGGGLSDLTADSKRFVGQNEIVGRLQDARKSRREEWLLWSEQRRKDPRLVALYQLGQLNQPSNNVDWRSDRRIANLAGSQLTQKNDASQTPIAAPVASGGAVVAAVRTTDRWQHRDGALDFSPTGSRVRLTVPGEYQSLTLMCWVKINSLDRWYNSLFLTDGHNLHEPHWQIMDDGRLFFSVKKRDDWNPDIGEKDKHVYYSPAIWDNSLSGRWIMLSTVYDVDARRVTHYMNGQLKSEEEIPEEYLVERVSIGNASLCNWSLPERDEPKFAVRNLNGSLDEFALFSAALSADEIQEMYEHGKP